MAENREVEKKTFEVDLRTQYKASNGAL